MNVYLEGIRKTQTLYILGGGGQRKKRERDGFLFSVDNRCNYQHCICITIRDGFLGTIDVTTSIT